jgi:hypothetical protein
MWRGVAATVLIVYAYGHPTFNGYRPAVIDRAIQSFHTEINGAARLGKDVLARVDRRRANDAIHGFIDRVEEELPKKN